MTEHHPTCPICAVYQGRVYSVSGNDPRFPALYETAFGRGYNTIHPRCGHSVAPWIEHLADDPAGERERSNRPFDVDPRTEKQRRAYEDGQRRKRQLREDRRQWERYRAELPDETPATFSAFRRMKAANSAGWQQLEASYRAVSYREPPVQPWEAQARRQRLPVGIPGLGPNVERSIAVPVNVVEKIVERHSGDIDAFDRLPSLLTNWEYAGRSPASPERLELYGRLDNTWFTTVIRLAGEQEAMNVLVTFHRIHERKVRSRERQGRIIARNH